MTAQRVPERAPSFTAYVDTEVDIEPEELQRAGWVYVGKPGKDGAREPMTESRFDLLVRDFHNDEHDGPMVWCRHGLCMEVVR